MTGIPGRTVLAATPPPLTEQAERLDRLWQLFLWIAVAVVVLVAGLLAVAILRRRDRGVLPPQTREIIPLEVAYVAGPLLLVAVLYALTVRSDRAVDTIADDETELVVDVLAFQWQWRFTYPDDGVVETGGPDEVPVLVLPSGTTVRFDLASADVVHSFWIPGFRFKRDVIPGRPTSFQVDVGALTGEWSNSGACAEFCGLDHHRMRFDVRVVTPDQFRDWLAGAHR